MSEAEELLLVGAAIVVGVVVYRRYHRGGCGCGGATAPAPAEGAYVDDSPDADGHGLEGGPPEKFVPFVRDAFAGAGGCGCGK